MAKKTSIGGQALIEGIMMRGPEKTAMAVRNIKTKEITLEEYPTKGADRPKICKLPFIRGIFNMYDSLSFGYKCLMRSAELSGIEDEEGEAKKEPSTWDKIFEKLMMPTISISTMNDVPQRGWNRDWGRMFSTVSGRPFS